MEIAKERPTKRKTRTTPRRNLNVAAEFSEESCSIDADIIDRLVRQVENLEVVQDEIGDSATDQPIPIASLSKFDNGIDAGCSTAEGKADAAEEEEQSKNDVEKVDVIEPVPESTVARDGSTCHQQVEQEPVSSIPDAIVVPVTEEPSAPVNELVADSSVESTKWQLYPEIARLREQELVTSVELSNLVKDEIRVQSSAPPMILALEPLTEMQLRSFYYNAELERVDDFIEEFLETTLRPLSNDEFFVLLQAYLDSCRRVEQLQLEAQDQNQRWDSARRNIWLMENVAVKQQGTCGDGRPASGVYTVQRAKFQDNCYQELQNLAQKRRHVRVVQLSFAWHQSKTAELQCCHFVNSAVQNFRAVTGVTAISPLFLRFDDPPEQLHAARIQIRNCISVLFQFVRQPVNESGFVSSCRSWLSELCGVLLRYCFVDDQLFMVSHILRCPNGTGVWAAGYVQPVCQLDSTVDGERAVDHFLAMLCICLNPIRRREEYLRSFLSPDVVNSWTIVDADGEEERELVAISEADLLCLLNQFSFDQLFSTWFGNLQKSELTEARILGLFAFELTFLRILFDGIRAYTGLHYRQICKQVAHEMRKSVHYVAEFWAYFKSLQSDELVIGRLQLEFDRLVLYMVFYGVSSTGLGVWQFLADLPYSQVSVDFQWRVVDLLVSATSQGMSPRDLSGKPIARIEGDLKDPKVLQMRLHDLDETDALYLMTALSEIASTSNDRALVRALVTLLLMTCFATPDIREVHHKAGRQLLRAVVERHTWLFSYLLVLIESKLDTLGGYALEIFDHLPISQWSLNEDDWAVLRRWLFQPLASLPASLSQRILLACNWGRRADTACLFIPQLLHRKVAEALVKAYDELCPVQVGLISGSIKKASKVASSMSGQLSTEQQFMDVCWALLLRLKLHPFDLEFMNGDSAMMDLPVETNELRSRARTGNPFAAFLAFQLCVKSMDSLTPLGFTLMEQLLNNYFAKPATVCVGYTLRILASDDTGPRNDEKWYRCFDALLHFDDTYYNYAKTLIGGSSVGDNLANLCSMLSETMLALTYGRQSDATKLVNYCLHLCCYSNSKQWNNDRASLYVMDCLIQAAFLNDPTLKDVIQILRLAYENTIMAQHRLTKGGMMWLFRGDKPAPSLLHSSYYHQFPWLAYVCIKAEQITFQQFNQNLTLEMIRNPKKSVENCVKDCGKKYDTHFTIEQSPAFMILELACSLDTNHPLLPLICQECCRILLRRIRVPDDPSLPLTCMGGRYLKIESFSSKFTMLKKSLQAVSMEQKRESGQDQMPASQMQLFSTVCAWFSDSRLFDPSLTLPANICSLPLFYILEGVLNGNETPWLEYVDFSSIRSCVEKRAKNWFGCRFGDTLDTVAHAQRPPSRVSPLHRLMERLSSGKCHTMMPAPKIGNAEPVILTPNLETLKEEREVFGLVEPLLDNFYAAANDFNDMHKSVLSLDQLFFEQLKMLYVDIGVQRTVILKCGRNCSSPKNKNIAVKISKIQENVQNNLDQNRAAWSNTIENVSALLAYNVPQHCVSFYAIVRELARLYRDSNIPDNARSRMKKTGVKLFYKLVSVCNERVLEFPPTKELIHATIGMLGSVFIHGNANEVEKLFELIKSKLELFNLLITFLDTACAPNQAFLRIYAKLADWIVKGALAPEYLVEYLKKMNITSVISRLSSSEIQQLNQLSIKASTASKAESHGAVLNALRNDYSQSVVAGLPANLIWSLESLLKVSEQGSTPAVLFDDFLVVLTGTVASDSVHLGPAVFSESVAYLTDYFARWRSKCKECQAFGIFHCWEQYAAKLPPLLSFCFLHSILNPEAYQSHAEGIRRSFSCLEGLFSPWIEAQCVSNHVYPPWSLSVAPVASVFVQAWVDSLLAVQRLFSGDSEGSLLTLTVEWYVRKVDTIVEKLGAYVVRTYHAGLLRLPWNSFYPSITSMEIIRQTVEKDNQSCPFITSLVVRLPWLEYLRSMSVMPTHVRATICDLLINIIIRCAAKEKNYTDCKASFPELLHNLGSLDWNCLDVSSVERICDYVLGVYDARCIISHDKQTGVEGGVFKLLSAACCLSNCFDWSDLVMQKRVRFVKMLVAFAVRCSRFNDVPVSSIGQFFVCLIGRIDSLIAMTNDITKKRTISLCLLSECVFFLHHANHKLFDETLMAMGAWMEDQPDSYIPLGLLEAYGQGAFNATAWVTVAEKCIRAYFARTSPVPTWKEILNYVNYKEFSIAAIKSECQEKCQLLSFYAVCCKRLQDRRELAEETLILRDVMETLKLACDRQVPEAPMVQLVGLAVDLLVRQVKFGAGISSIVPITRELATCLQNAADGKSGILSSLGLTRRISYSPRFQLLHVFLSNYIAQQIIDDDHLRLSSASVVVNSKVTWMKSLRSQKAYAAFQDVLEITSAFFTDSSKHFEDTLALYTRLAPVLFSERYVIDQCSVYAKG